MKSTVLLLLLIVTLSVYQVESQYAQCTGGQMCIPFGECDELKRIAAKGTLTPQELNLIRSKQCNYVNRSAYVCCAAQNQNGQTNTSPTGNRGNFLPLPPVCGPAFADRIVGGTETDIDEFPWIAQIQYRKADRTIGSHCGGSLINDRFVITAAHCVRKVPQTWQLVQVRLGEYDTRSNPDCNDFITGSVCNDPYVEVAVSQIIVHPEYLADAKHQPNDIALLKLQTAVRYTNYIKPVCLPAPTLRTLDWTGHALEVAGFGKTEFVNSNPVKLKVDVDAFSTVECKNIYKTLPLTDKQICAGGKKGKDSCNGDSGGPLMKYGTYPNSQTPYYMLVGIVSFGPKDCGTKDVPGVYTKVSEYMDWINSNI